MIDFNLTLSEQVNQLIDENLQVKRAREVPREYLGASRLGINCSRALQYQYMNVPTDEQLSGRAIRIFEIGHEFEKLTLNWLRDAGFAIVTESQLDGQAFGFTTADGRIQGHLDGVIEQSPIEKIKCPAIWECKSMNAKSWKQTVEQGVKKAKPIYYVQIVLYQAYMSLFENPALFTAVNKDTAEIYHELVEYDGKIAQEASDKGVNILRATLAGETLPRFTNNPDHFECRFCNWRKHCWKESVLPCTL
jgi:hypothetical protein